MGKVTLSYERHPSLFKKGKLLAKGESVIDVQGYATNPKVDLHKTFLEGTYVTNAGYRPQSEYRLYERERIKSGKPALHYHQTAIARDINNVRKRRS